MKRNDSPRALLARTYRRYFLLIAFAFMGGYFALERAIHEPWGSLVFSAIVGLPIVLFMGLEVPRRYAFCRFGYGRGVFASIWGALAGGQARWSRADVDRAFWIWFQCQESDRRHD